MGAWIRVPGVDNIMKISYNRRLTGSAFVLVGAGLLIEHIYRWGFQFWDFIGHEWFGLLLIIAGIFIVMDWDKSHFSKELRRKK